MRCLDAREMLALEAAIEPRGNLAPPHGRVIDLLPLGRSLLFEVDVLLQEISFYSP